MFREEGSPENSDLKYNLAFYNEETTEIRYIKLYQTAHKHFYDPCNTYCTGPCLSLSSLFFDDE